MAEVLQLTLVIVAWITALAWGIMLTLEWDLDAQKRELKFEGLQCKLDRLEQRSQRFVE